MISADDEPTVRPYRWRLLRRGKNVYARTEIDGAHVLMHRLLLSPMPAEMVVDHIDGNGLNNIRSNLRVCKTRENVWNNRTRSLTGFHGVTKSGSRWLAKWVSNGEYRYAGCYETAIEAALAYNDAIKLERGDFARLNTVSKSEACAVLETRLAQVETEAERLRRWIKELSA